MKIGEQIVKILLAEIPGLHNIAFLPYKVEMFDSMWSIYDAARLAGMNAVVIPLPYRKTTEQEYHVDQFPVPTLTANHIVTNPYDLYVIHNPYDQDNRVTEISQQFCTDILKRKAKIAYVAYYIGDTPIHFKKRPAVLNADIIFANTEEEAAHFRYANPEAKVFTTGSPKLDFASRKKGDCILIANSLLPLVTNGEVRIEKYKQIILDHKDSHIIFRPHPLLMDGLKVMAPDAVNAYKNFLHFCIVNRVELDTEPIIWKTFERCGKCYCDPSNTHLLWEATGKPLEII